MTDVDTATFEKMFSVGIGLSLTPDDWDAFLNEWGRYVYDVYFSLPLGMAHHSRLDVVEEFAQPQAEEALFSILDVLRRHGVKLEAALNTDNLDDEHVAEGLAYVRKHVRPDSVVTLARFGERAREALPEVSLVYSYNNGVRYPGDIDAVPDVFDEIVLGNACIRDEGMMAQARARGLRTKLLLNNGCSFNCAWCRAPEHCGPTFQANLKERSAEELYALQSLFPWEIHRHVHGKGLVDRYKISSRPSTLAYLQRCMRSYLRGGERALVAADARNYRLWGRLGSFGPYFDAFSFARINRVKEELWSRPVAERRLQARP